MKLVVEALLVILPYSDVTSDLSTQCLSRRWRADNTLEIGSHVLTEITIGISSLQ
jgi:hypothetical protein